MNGGLSPRGYTIVEVMIFLAVTGALLVSALAIFQGQQGRTDFATGAREMESRMQDIINDVASGYYPSSGTVPCRKTAGALDFSGTAAPQGTNQDCIFIGRAPQFNLVGGGNRQYNVYTIAGLRETGTGFNKKEVQSFDQAEPQAVVSPVDLTQSDSLPSALRFGNMYYTYNAIQYPADAVAFFSSFSKYTDSSLQPGTLSVNVVPLNANGAAGSTKAEIVAQIAALGTGADPAYMNPNGGVTICFNSNASNQHAVMTIGSWRARTTTNMEIKTGSCP